MPKKKTQAVPINSNQPSEPVKPIRKRNIGWFILTGLAFVIIAAGIVLFFMYQEKTKFNATRFEKTLADYYQAQAKKDDIILNRIRTDDFTDDNSGLVIKPGKYKIYSYQYTNLETTNIGETQAQILFSLNLIQNRKDISVFCEADFILSGFQPKISHIKKIYTGINITGW